MDSAPNTLRAVLDAFWRAAWYCLHPRVMLLSLLPVLVSGGLAFVLGHLFWADAIEALGGWLESSVTLTVLWGWLEAVGLPRLKAVLPHVILLLLLTPAVVVVSLAAVSFLMAPALVRLVAGKRFPDLQMLHGAPWWHGVLWTLWSAVLAVSAMVISLPMWMIPPLLLVLPPLIWGWLTYRVMAFDALAQHASADRLHPQAHRALRVGGHEDVGEAARREHRQVERQVDGAVRLGVEAHRVRVRREVELRLRLAKAEVGHQQQVARLAHREEVSAPWPLSRAGLRCGTRPPSCPA